MQKTQHSTACERPTRLVNVKTGEVYEKPCGCRISSTCAPCASSIKEALEERLFGGTRGITPDQAVSITATLHAFTETAQAEMNSVSTFMRSALWKRLKREFGCDVKGAIAPETSGTKIHLQGTLIFKRTVSPHDMARIRHHLRAVHVHTGPAKTGRKVHFGHFWVRPVHSYDHLENLVPYPAKDTDRAMSESCPMVSERMDAHIVRMRNEGKHRMGPVKRRDLQGGMGFRGRRVFISKNWLEDFTFSNVVPTWESYFDYAFENDMPSMSWAREHSTAWKSKPGTWIAIEEGSEISSSARHSRDRVPI